MKFDFGLERLWANKNKEIQDKVRLNPLSAARIYPGISCAVAEISRGLVRLFPHRRQFAVIKGCGPFYDEISEFLGMEGLGRTEINVNELKNPDECIKKIPKDCLFILGSYDDPFTGECFNFEKLFPTLHQNRTFTVSLSHSVHLARGFPQVSNYMAVVAKIPKQGAVALLGQRAARVPPLFHGMADWFEPSNWKNDFQPVSEAQSEILQFERKLPKGFVPFFDQDATRIYDRAVVRALEFDGEACIQLLSKELGLPLREPGTDGIFETLSLCRWDAINTFNWYVEQGRVIQDLRGVFMIDLSMVNSKTLAALEKVSATLFDLQS